MATKYQFTKDLVVLGVRRKKGESADDLDRGTLESCLQAKHVKPVEPPTPRRQKTEPEPRVAA